MAKLISLNQFNINIDVTNRPFSPRLINWVEPVEVKGFLKTGIYTEVDSGLKVGDRVFIVNGNYDNDLLIKEDKYKKGRDGYKILSIDRCKIVLDIDYTGDLPWVEDSVDDFIRIYGIRDNSEFKYVNRLITSKGGTFSNRFDYYQNNIVFSDTNYSGFLGYGENGGITSAPGFFIKNGTASWTDITTDFINNNLSIYTSANNSRIKVMSTFTHNNKEYKEGFIYKYENNEWVVDVTYFRPFITKGNFRDGNFKGVWNTGLFGRQDKKIKWEGIGSSWNIGTLLNSCWEKGNINSIFTSKESYFADIDEFGLPYQKINPANNRGFGYNYIIDSEIKSSTINNGVFEKTILGTQSATFSVVEHYFLSWTQSLDININNGEFSSCDFESSIINNSEIKNSRLNNSKTIKSKSTNSHYKDSLFYNSNFNSDSIIKITGYDEWNACLELNTSTDNQYKIYKFYISEDSYNRLEHKDHFYIKGLRFNNNLKEVINYFDKRFILDTYTEYDDGKDITNVFRKINKAGSLYTVCLSTPEENSYKLVPITDISSNYTTIAFGQNPNKLPSIDIIVKQSILPNTYTDFSNLLLHGKDFNVQFDTPPSYLTPSYPISLGNIIDTTDAYIIDSDFRSGLVENSNWNSGNHINYGHDANINNLSDYGGDYNILIPIIGGNKINVEIPDPGISDNFIKLGDIVYLNGVDYDNTFTVTRLPETYKITNIIPTFGGRTLELEEMLIGTTVSIVSGLTASGFFYTKNAQNRYNYIHRSKINKSTLKSGIFRQTHITNSLLNDDGFNSSDKDFDNLTKIRNSVFSDILFVGNNNVIKSGTHIYSSLTTGDIWISGIFYDSIWNGSTFSSGTLKDSRWVDGVFENGLFYNSRTFVSSDPYHNDYDSEFTTSYYKDGTIALIGNQMNNRKSWQKGIFKNGEFYKSNWESGYFQDGKFYLSNWYGGTFSNGKIGDIKLSPTDTNFYNGVFDNGIVENARLFAYDSSFFGSSSSVIFNNGIFNSGVFGTDNSIQVWTLLPMETYAVWNNGTFNGGEFTTNGRWKNGTFNGGKFLSEWGWTMSSSTYSTDYSWEYGVFNGGEFGNANNATNSTWFSGEFNGGIFKGRVWNNGVMTNGEFSGSATYSSVGGLTCSNASNFVDSFTSSYYGLWRNGTVTDVKDKFIKDKKIFTELQRIFTEKKPLKSVKIKNSLWISGTFSHPTGEFNNSVWLDGKFESGVFKASSFNPYVKRDGSTQSTFNFNDDTCFWRNGSLDNSEFYISKWEDGKFLLGTAVGMIWENGTTNYMNAFNVFWENGTWRNGNWYGSSWELSGDGSVTDDYVRQILFRGMSWSGTSSCHVWNIFLEENFPPLDVSSASASTVTNVGVSPPPPFIPPPSL